MARPTVILDRRTNRGYRATYQTEGGRWVRIQMRWNGSLRRMVGKDHEIFDKRPVGRKAA